METTMKKLLLIGLYLFVCCFLSCENSVDPHNGSNEDLIQNSSFEIDGNPSLNGWIYKSNFPTDTLYTTFSNDIPPSGGNWSVLLRVGDRQVKYLQTKIAAPAGTNRYRLSVWAKGSLSEQGNSGFVSLALNKTDIKRIAEADNTWKYYESIDTISANIGDTLTVTLFSGASARSQSSYFDLCRLELLK